jgi:hypothetical protein
MYSVCQQITAFVAASGQWKTSPLRAGSKPTSDLAKSPGQPGVPGPPGAVSGR